MSTQSKPRALVFVVGIIAMLAGILTIGYLPMAFAFMASAPNTFSDTGISALVLLSTLWLIIFSVMDGLALLIPFKIGRRLRMAGPTTPDSEVVPKVYRNCGITLIVAAGLAVVVNLLFLKDLLLIILEFLIIAGGVIGLLASLRKAINSNDTLKQSPDRL